MSSYLAPKTKMMSSYLAPKTKMMSSYLAPKTKMIASAAYNEVFPRPQNYDGWYVPPEEETLRKLIAATPEEKEEILRTLAVEQQEKRECITYSLIKTLIYVKSILVN